LQVCGENNPRSASRAQKLVSSLSEKFEGIRITTSLFAFNLSNLVTVHSGIQEHCGERFHLRFVPDPCCLSVRILSA
jgi:hypothetical protein